jgi:hypothetical protein
MHPIENHNLKMGLVEYINEEMYYVLSSLGREYSCMREKFAYDARMISHNGHLSTDVRGCYEQATIFQRLRRQNIYNWINEVKRIRDKQSIWADELVKQYLPNELYQITMDYYDSYAWFEDYLMYIVGPICEINVHVCDENSHVKGNIISNLNHLSTFDVETRIYSNMETEIVCTELRDELYCDELDVDLDDMEISSVTHYFPGFLQDYMKPTPVFMESAFQVPHCPVFLLMDDDTYRVRDTPKSLASADFSDEFYSYAIATMVQHPFKYVELLTEAYEITETFPDYWNTLHSQWLADMFNDERLDMVAQIFEIL